MSLAEYKAKRDFKQTPEPRKKGQVLHDKLVFVIHRHQASTLHYDFRLEMEGVLKSWAVPKGPSLNPTDKRLAVMVEDHPFSYRTFEGDIPAGNYGAGHVDIWDQGTYHALEKEDKVAGEKELLQGLKKGSISFFLQGSKIKGAFSLVKMKGRQENAWLLLKKDDEFAVTEPYNSEDFAGGNTPVKSKKVAPENKTAQESNSGKNASTRDKNKASAGIPAMPRGIIPMMAKLVDAPFNDEKWLFETKWDGFRAIAEVEGGQVTLYSRSGNSFNDRYPPVLEALRKLNHQAVLDGEIVVLDEHGKVNFQALQNYQNTPAEGIFYQVFDLLYLDGEDLRDKPLLVRKQKLQEILPANSKLRYSEHILADGIAFFKQAQQANIEGMMAKLADSRYQTGKRSDEWLKIKTHLRQEAVIAGFTEPKGSRKYLGALLLGVYRNGKLEYAGQSGSGFNLKSLQALHEKLMPLVQEKSPFVDKKINETGVRWVKPELVCEISFAEWTSDNQMRQAIFEGLRDDKKSRDVTQEAAIDTEEVVAKVDQKSAGRTGSARASDTRQKATLNAGSNEKNPDREVPLSNLQKIYWPDENITKGDLIAYYQAVADTILPYLKDRPESLLRHPNGIKASGFFQKDIGGQVPDWIQTAAIHSESTDEDVEYLVCQDKETLAYMNNLGCIQLNPWNSRLQNLNKPDYLVLDLDPGENTYDEVIEVALVAKNILDQAGIPVYCKTSGATGMHLYVPLAARYEFARVKELAHVLATRVHEQLPELTSLERNPKERRTQIYLDFLQNAIGQTIAAPYSVRPKPGATVSAPLKWAEVKKGLHPSQFTLKNMPDRIKQEGDLFKSVLGPGIDLPNALQALKG